MKSFDTALMFVLQKTSAVLLRGDELLRLFCTAGDSSVLAALVSVAMCVLIGPLQISAEHELA